jgi:hypothetical protein
MGWSSGNDVAYPIIKAIKKNVKDDVTREKIYVALIDAFEDADCDTLYELKGIDPAFDQFFPEEEE